MIFFCPDCECEFDDCSGDPEEMDNCDCIREEGVCSDCAGYEF